jgi:heme oxygenase
MMSDQAPHAMLRAATAAAHEALHHLAAFAALADGRIDRAGYRVLLGRLLGFHAPIEAAIAACLGEHAFDLDLSRLQRAKLLRDDLAALGATQATIDTLKLMPVPAFGAPAQAMGALYVLEGATLGGRRLALGLDPLLGRGTLPGRRFLLAGADPQRPAWREVRAALDRCGADHVARQGMIAGANATFTAFGMWFAEPPARAARACG